jgi:hypothetical protein
MAHQAQTYIKSILIPGTPSVSAIQSHVLNMREANLLLRYLKSDAVSYIYSAIISIADATVSLRKGLFTWATVKLYYATFYAFRAFLALDSVCIFYIGTRPYAIEANPGEMPVKRNGQTHKVVLDEFRYRQTEPFLLSQQIALEDPLDWLVDKREEANYKIAKFWEPNVPKHFEKIMNYGLRKSIKEYLLDSSNLYVFDVDHAILAYPLRSLQLVYQKMLTMPDFHLTDDEISYLCQLFHDQNGPIPEIHDLLRR